MRVEIALQKHDDSKNMALYFFLSPLPRLINSSSLKQDSLFVYSWITVLLL